jgi:lactate racemase
VPSGNIPSPLGAFDGGVETPHIRVALTTGIPEKRRRRVDLGHTGHRAIDLRGWAGREAEGILLVPHAGGVLCRSKPQPRVEEPA